MQMDIEKWQFRYRNMLGTLLSNIKNNFQDNKKTIVLYPNPASEEVHVTINQNIGYHRFIRIFSIEGRFIDEFNIDNNNTITLDLKNYHDGVYFIQIYSGTNVYYDKFIKY